MFKLCIDVVKSDLNLEIFKPEPKTKFMKKKILYNFIYNTGFMVCEKKKNVHIYYYSM